MTDTDHSAELEERVRACAASHTPLCPEGGGTKRFLGRAVQAETLHCAGHRGIVSYEPTELVITARCGTPLAELEQTLRDSGQMLPFEPPAFGEQATVGGTIAAGLSGPRRPFAGSARDLVLGVRLLNGNGESLRFGGEVMKNVAGYDVSRLMTGSMGTLAVLLDVSMKVLPRPQAETTVEFEHTAVQAVASFNEWAGQPIPLSAACHLDGRSIVRLSGSASAVESARTRLGGTELPDGETFWSDLREHRLAFFAGDRPLWRISVPATAPPLALPGEVAMDWGGALRWLRTDADADAVRAVASAQGGHATAFRGGDASGEIYHPLPGAILRLHRRIKEAFDPHGIFSPGRLYDQL
jgi:glycolate oxidase FAD binding subunit